MPPMSILFPLMHYMLVARTRSNSCKVAFSRFCPCGVETSFSLGCVKSSDCAQIHQSLKVLKGLQVLHWALEVLLPTELWTRFSPVATLDLHLHLSQLFNKHCQRHQVFVRPRQRPSPIAWRQTMETCVPASSISMHSSSASSPPEQVVQYDLIDI